MAARYMTLNNGARKLVEASVASAGAGDAGKIPALDSSGRLDESLMPLGIGADTIAAPATETLGAGKFVNFHDDEGVFSVRLADNSNGRRADGFVIEEFEAAATATVYPMDGVNSALTGLTPATRYYLGTDAREWTATTVTQAEAEQGTATTRRAWTAQRVFQAVAAWWSASAMKTKLDGIAAGATANATDAQLRDRSTHTGTQAISTVTGLQTVLDGKINTSERGVSGGIPTLDEFARIPPSQLPSYVDDVLEFATTAQFPTTGEGGKIYIAINQGTAANPTRQYRWTGSVYAEINPSPGTTDALAEGSTNLYFSEHRVRNTVLTGLSLAVSTAITAADTVLSALGKLQAKLNTLGTAAYANLSALPGRVTITGTDAVPLKLERTTSTNVSLWLQHSGASKYLGINAAGNYAVADSADITNNGNELWHGGNLVKQASSTDTTAGALLMLAPGGGGSFGIGSYKAAEAAALNATPNGITWCNGSTLNRPFGLTSSIFSFRGSESYGGQLSSRLNRLGYRSLEAGTYGAWQEVFHTGNFDPATKQDRATFVNTSTSRTLGLSDAWRYLRPTNSGAITLTVPTNADVAFEASTEITIRAAGSGNVTLAGGPGVTINPPANGTLVLSPGMTVVLKRVGSSLWDLIGQTVAA